MRDRWLGVFIISLVTFYLAGNGLNEEFLDKQISLSDYLERGVICAVSLVLGVVSFSRVMRARSAIRQLEFFSRERGAERDE